MEVWDEALERVVVEKLDQKDVVVGRVEREGWDAEHGEDVVSKVGRKRLDVRW